MTSTVDQLVTVVTFITNLASFPVFCVYLLTVALAPWWRKVCAPMDLKYILVIYNFGVAALNLYTTYGATRVFLLAESSFLREPFEGLAFVYEVYWVAKFLELLDTVFMILRHKQRQISFLHVFHHSSMLMLTDVTYHYYPYIAIVLYLGLNSFVHVVLYLYYGLTALGNPPPWKKLLTQFQITQFLIYTVHSTIGYLYHGYCIYGIFYALSMTALFSQFYYVAYLKKRKDVGAGDRKLKKLY